MTTNRRSGVSGAIAGLTALAKALEPRTIGFRLRKGPAAKLHKLLTGDAAGPDPYAPRPITDVTPEERANMASLQSSYLGRVFARTMTPRQVWLNLAKEYRRYVAYDRLGQESLPGVAPLRAYTVRKKGHRRIGVDTGDLQDSVIEAPLIVKGSGS